MIALLLARTGGTLQEALVMALNGRQEGLHEGFALLCQAIHLHEGQRQGGSECFAAL